MATEPHPKSNGRSSRKGSRRLRRLLLLGSGLIGLAVVAIVAAALVPGGHSDGNRPFSVASVAPHQAAADSLHSHITKVVGSNIPAKKFGTEVADQENRGLNTRGQPIGDLTPLPASAFAKPVARFRIYAERWAVRLGHDLPTLRTTLATGSRPASKRAWEIAWSDYLHLGAVYGLLPGKLDREMDGMPETVSRHAHFTGLHRIEMGLWTSAAPQSLVKWVVMLQHDDITLRHVLPRVQIDPLNYATRAHEILEDAQRDFLSGVDVPWSHAGVLATAAGLAATNELVRTLTGMMEGRDNTYVEVRSWMLQLGHVLDQLHREHGDSWPTLNQLTDGQREQINGTVAGALGALEQIPGTLETKQIPVIPSIRKGAG
jgi:hypothetical protein